MMSTKKNAHGQVGAATTSHYGTEHTAPHSPKQSKRSQAVTAAFWAILPVGFADYLIRSLPLGVA